MSVILYGFVNLFCCHACRYVSCDVAGVTAHVYACYFFIFIVIVTLSWQTVLLYMSGPGFYVMCNLYWWIPRRMHWNHWDRIATILPFVYIAIIGLWSLIMFTSLAYWSSFIPWISHIWLQVPHPSTPLQQVS